MGLSFSDRSNWVQLLKPYTRHRMLLLDLTIGDGSICLELTSVYLGDLVEFKPLQALRSLEIDSVAESVRESCLLTEEHVGLHHIS